MIRLKKNIEATKINGTAIIDSRARDGLNLNTNRVRRAADYTAKGAGSIKARTKSNRKYDSRDKAKRVTVHKKDFGDQVTAELIKKLFSAILGL